MNRKEFISTPFTAYDKNAEYDEHIRPHIDALHAECERLGMPMYCVVCVEQEANGNSAVKASAYFNGAETTPAELVAAAKAGVGKYEEIPLLMFLDIERVKVAREAINGIQKAATLEA